MYFNLDNDRLICRPTPSLVADREEEPLRLLGLLEVLDRLLEQVLADVAESRRREEIRSSGAIVASIVIATVWLLTAATASGLVVAYISR